MRARWRKNRSGSMQFQDRIISTGNNFAYVRIADGCDNFCTFCAIPYIRGRFKSRTKEDILQEVKMLAKQGIREIIVIAQDTTKYGIDIYRKPKLAEILHEISKIPRYRVGKIFIFISRNNYRRFNRRSKK